MLSMIWDAAAMGGEVEVGPDGLADDTTLRTAVLVSLFTDRRAEADDELPDDDGDRRGWIGDALSDSDRIGSRLWLLKRRKQTEQTRLEAEEYCREALAWLVEDGIASAVEVVAAWEGGRSGWLTARVGVILPNGSQPAFSYSISTAGT